MSQFCRFPRAFCSADEFCNFGCWQPGFVAWPPGIPGGAVAKARVVLKMHGSRHLSIFCRIRAAPVEPCKAIAVRFHGVYSRSMPAVPAVKGRQHRWLLMVVRGIRLRGWGCAGNACWDCHYAKKQTVRSNGACPVVLGCRVANLCGTVAGLGRAGESAAAPGYPAEPSLGMSGLRLWH